MPIKATKRDTQRIGRRLKLRDLRILMTVAEHGTMNKAAERLSVSQPVVSKAIADMEYTLGVRLLDRSRLGVEPTPYGQALIKRGIAIFDEMQQGLKDIDFLSDPATGEVRVGVSDPIATAIVSPVIDRLSHDHPRMRFHVVVADTAPLFAALEARTADLVITRIAGRVSDEHNAEILFHDALVVGDRGRQFPGAEAQAEPCRSDGRTLGVGTQRQLFRCVAGWNFSHVRS